MLLFYESVSEILVCSVITIEKSFISLRLGDICPSDGSLVGDILPDNLREASVNILSGESLPDLSGVPG